METLHSLFQIIQIGVLQGLLLSAAVVSFAVSFRLMNFPDVSIEGSLPLGAAVYAVFVRGGTSPVIAALFACAVGSACGATTAYLNLRFQVNQFLSGIIVSSVCYSLSLRIMDGPNIGLLEASRLLPVANYQLSLGMVAFATTFGLCALLQSRVGIPLRAAGANPSFATSMGLNSGLLLALGLAIGNGYSAFAGVLQADYQGFADLSSGQGTLIIALASLAIGEAVTPSKRLPYPLYVCISALLGSVTYGVLLAIAVRSGLSPRDLRLATALLVLVAVASRTLASKGPSNLPNG